jgi:hypothetical protein
MEGSMTFKKGQMVTVNTPLGIHKDPSFYDGRRWVTDVILNKDSNRNIVVGQILKFIKQSEQGDMSDMCRVETMDGLKVWVHRSFLTPCGPTDLKGQMVTVNRRMGVWNNRGYSNSEYLATTLQAADAPHGPNLEVGEKLTCVEDRAEWVSALFIRADATQVWIEKSFVTPCGIETKENPWVSGGKPHREKEPANIDTSYDLADKLIFERVKEMVESQAKVDEALTIVKDVRIYAEDLAAADSRESEPSKFEGDKFTMMFDDQYEA